MTKDNQNKWTREGIGWRRKNYVIRKPFTQNDPWSVHRIRGEAGEETLEREDSFIFENQAFDHANKKIRIDAMKRKLHQARERRKHGRQK